MSKDSHREPDIGDLILYHHHDRDVVYPGWILEVNKFGEVSKLQYFGDFNGGSEVRKGKSVIDTIKWGSGRGQWQFK